MQSTLTEARRAAHERIEAEIAAFLGRGGAIEKLASGATSGSSGVQPNAYQRAYKAKSHGVVTPLIPGLVDMRHRGEG